MADEPRYRLATPADAARIADLHTANWRRSYRGILSDGYLDGGLVAERAARWRAWAERPAAEASGALTVLAEAPTEPGELIGFVHVVADADDRLGALVDNLHVHHEWQRHGIARRLMGEAGRWAAGRGQPGAYLYVLGANTRAQAFYEAVGGVRGAAGRWQPPEGPEVDDLEYLWSDLRVLAALVPPGTPSLR